MSNLRRYTLYIINAIDLASCFLAYLIAYYIRFRFPNIIPGRPGTDYINFLLVIMVAYFIYNFTTLYKDGSFLGRNTLKEVAAVLKMVAMVMLITFLYLNFTKLNASYSRIFEGVYFVSLFIISLAIRTIVKGILLSSKYHTGEENVLLIVSYKELEKTLKEIEESMDWRYKINGILIPTVSLNEKTINGIKVIENNKDALSIESLSQFDSVIIIPGNYSEKTINDWISKIQNAGKKVSVRIPEYSISGSYTSVDSVVGMPVVTYTTLTKMNGRQSLVKRLIDIVLSLLLLPVYLVVFIIVKIFTSLESAGPILVKRIRIGRNNRPYSQYRFRLYRIDAAERIKNNESPYTYIGKVLYHTHLDGLPLILNVLVGDMSFIGPKSPNIPLYLSMSTKERSFLYEKPGIVGPWTAEKDKNKARNETQDYVENWSIFKDITIIVYCILRYISFKSLRIHGDTHEDEELKYVKDIQERNKPLEYDRSLYRNNVNIIYAFIKRMIDILLSAIGSLVLLPVFLIISILIILDDGGSPLYSHSRIGKNGKKIKVYKFRSMRTDAGELEDLLTPEQLEQYQKEFKIDNDPRITKIGNFTRKTSIDELPQILNILKGDMSIIGPRPLVEKEIKQCYNDEQIAKFLSVKPGLTGYWQAYARNNATYESGERQKMEMNYVDNQSLLLDIRIFFKTIISVLKKEGAK